MSLSFVVATSDEVSMMSADNRPMAVLPKVDAGGDYVLELLPRVRYRVKTLPDIRANIFFDSGVLLVPEKDGEYAIAINLSDRMAIAKCGGSPPDRSLRKSWRQESDT